MHIRPASSDDADFLLTMLVEACNWSGLRFTRSEVASNSHLKRYVAEWERPGDLGVIAVGADDELIGAAWARALSEPDQGYGFVAEDIPEITMAVVEARRGCGIGRELLTSLIAEARSRRIRALSLSVEDGNRAKQLYEASGFVTVGQVENADTMLLELG